MAMTFSLTGCGTTKELRTAYNKMKVGEKEEQINGYDLDISFNGSYNDEVIREKISVNNYLGKDFKVTTNKNVYYIVDGKKYKSERQELMGHEFKMDRNRETNFSETDEDIPFIDTDRYLVPLKSAKADDVALKDTIGELELTTYTYSVKKKDAQKLLADTSLANEKLVANVPAKVWLDKDGYVYKIEYDISAGFKTSKLLLLTVFYNGIDNASSITVNPGVADFESPMENE